MPVSLGAEGKAVPAAEEATMAPAPAAAPVPAAAPAAPPAAPLAPSMPGQISKELEKIFGGRSHFVKKNHIKTHRHHNRRNRHKTLKNKA